MSIFYILGTKARAAAINNEQKGAAAFNPFDFLLAYQAKLTPPLQIQKVKVLNYGLVSLIYVLNAKQNSIAETQKPSILSYGILGSISYWASVNQNTAPAEQKAQASSYAIVGLVYGTGGSVKTQTAPTEQKAQAVPALVSLDYAVHLVASSFTTEQKAQAAYGLSSLTYS